jgi:hypothetical protein
MFTKKQVLGDHFIAQFTSSQGDSFDIWFLCAENFSSILEFLSWSSTIQLLTSRLFQVRVRMVLQTN